MTWHPKCADKQRNQYGNQCLARLKTFPLQSRASRLLSFHNFVGFFQKVGINRRAMVIIMASSYRYANSLEGFQQANAVGQPHWFAARVKGNR
jgi:hypothetical protein